MIHGELKTAGDRTGTVVVLVDQDGNRTMFPDSGANSRLSETDLPTLQDVALAFISGYALFNPKSSSDTEAMAVKIRAAGIPIFLDVASVGTISAFGKEAAISLLKGFTGIFLNESEAAFLTMEDQVSEQLLKLEKITDLAIIKRGAAGVSARQSGGNTLEVPGVKVDVVDTTGAGDAFAAGFLQSWLHSQDLLAALTNGVEIATKCVTTIGARPRVITPE